MRFGLGELFCGPGGLGWGAVHADIGLSDWGIDHVWATDYDAMTCETYRKNLCPDRMDSVLCQDVRELDMSSLPDINALAFGFPCNDFSTVGEQKGFAGTYGPLYTYGAKALRLFQPDWFLAENVSGLQSANDGKALDRILSEFEACGYRLYTNLYKFEQYGIPQARHRIIIIGIRSDLPVIYRVPSPALYAGRDNTCETALRDIPAWAKNQEITRQSEKVIRRLSYIKPGENVFTANLPDDLKLNVKGATISQIYRRLDPHKPAYTVTGSGGGGTHMYHWSEPRALTNRERARLQTFPDYFTFMGTKEQVRKQIGMAVPCQGAKLIFEAILRSFAGVDYEWVPCNM